MSTGEIVYLAFTSVFLFGFVLLAASFISNCAERALDERDKERKRREA